mgnify:CR=1 FL=1
MSSKVYSMDARSQSLQTGLVPKMLTVFEAAGFDSIIRRGDLVAVKTHCGEWNNTAYLRPVYARTLADHIKALGGRPFVCDTTTLPYSPMASRSTEVDLLVTAERNGFTPAALGCPFICADGFMGTDDCRVELPEGFILKEAYVATAIAAADALIVLSHFKGHPIGVVGGAIKNLGIGAQSKRGKFNVHMGGHPRYGFGAANEFHPENYKGRKGDPNWRELEEACPFGLIRVTEDSVEWDRDKCNNCVACRNLMVGRGIFKLSTDNFRATNAAMADACLATMKAVGRERVGFINLAIDISPWCDCAPFADAPIVPNLGVLASSDPVAIDKACLDMARQAVGVQGSRADDKGVMGAGQRKFEACSPLVADVGEEIQVNTGELIGLGSTRYELVQVPAKPMADFIFPPDPRPVGTRLREKVARIPPFPYDRHDGKGFLREEEVDLERVSRYA